MVIAAQILFILFTLIASIDAFYFHFYRFRLHQRAECRREHLLHTANSCLLPFGASPLLLGDAEGFVLWIALLANLATFWIESLDVLGERESREFLGGLPSVEYWMHFTMSGLRWAWVALAIAAIPESSWLSGPRWDLPEIWSSIPIMTATILLGSIPIAAFHAYFLFDWSHSPFFPSKKSNKVI